MAEHDPTLLARARQGQAVAATLVQEWQALRLALRQLEEAEHPPIVDSLGRAWTWIDKELYGHDGMAWPRDFLKETELSLPSPRVLANPNYRWCDICRGPAAQLGRRRVPVVEAAVVGGRL